MYFNNFPKILYNGVEARNILLKSALISEIFESADSFYPYIVSDGVRPDAVSNEVYGTPFLDWLVYFSNRVVDPYYEWPLESADFKAYLEKKYSSSIYTLMNTTSHYEYGGVAGESSNDVARNSWKMSVDTYTLCNTFADGSNIGWNPISIYDYEDRLNEQRRSIRLLANRYVPQITAEIATIFKK